ncbi:hypothetical protein ASPZODRAFT_131713 [Penicilliopsis zonata CBS 506.65]|uniref:Uncharacterized protein n=1 Tax=Penicilliopsis zonata CBS 506.65 TaxID=1073090 RepID=A0A1L9SIB4_9EURO|nr:hypothetical protein ASPZODRAFT_131713 [Penicilliopsis zonata CBS 506.65]OJJ46823.1 hypothetical protein ASPZODRAFT_131713 [Penicilliopsis zonata CBS 506.65]
MSLRYDPDDWPLPSPSRRASNRTSSVSSSTVDSETISLLSLSNFPPPPVTPATSPGIAPRKASCLSLLDETVRLELNPSVTISFVRNSKLFKLRYTFIDVVKDSTGTLRCLELGGGMGQSSAFLHSFQNTKLPVPHVEHPKLPNEPSLRVSFLDEQTVQSGTTVFTTQLAYTFDTWMDCVRFQEALLASKLVFIAGIAEARSKGRGEECISQNIRVLCGRNDKLVLLFFANSQRKELKRYISIPINCIESFHPGKRAGKPVVLTLQPNFDLLTHMKTLQIEFLEDSDRLRFCDFLNHQLR